MSALKKFFNTIPAWAFTLVLIVLAVNSLYLHFKYQIPEDTSTYKFENGQVIFDYIKPGSSDDKVGIKSGDVLVSIDSIPIERWDNEHALSAGDSVVIRVFRKGRLLDITTKMTTFGSNAPIYNWSVFFIMLLFNIAGLFILYKKPKDKTVKLFFIFLQLFSVTINALTLPLPNMVSVSATWIFLLSGLLMGPLIIHFHLTFPRSASILNRMKWLPWVFYGIASLFFIPYAITAYLYSFNINKFYALYSIFDRIGLLWIAATFFIALSIAVTKFITIKDSLSRNQLRMVIIGSVFGFITPIAFGILYPLFESYQNYSSLVIIPHSIGSIIMIAFVTVAIFRYHIWETEVFIRKVLLYLGATIIITTSYLLLIHFTDRFIELETNLIRFIILAVSVLLFLLLRDWLQRRIDRIFNREIYDSTSVVSGFEEKMEGTYRMNELGPKIMECMDDIFHFKSLVMGINKGGYEYQGVFLGNTKDLNIRSELVINEDFEIKLNKSNVFSPAELHQKPSFLDNAEVDLVVPLLKDKKPFGFFICGPKKSEKAYSMQDIRVLTLIAKRVISLFHTATLYQQDLNRQLMLERERARISQDMHDDIGAGLTKIAMITESMAASGETANDKQLTANGKRPTANDEQMRKVSTTAREMIGRLNVIVWALNPKYDNLDSLISYARRYFGEYLENFGVDFRMEVYGDIPDLPVTPDFRRNAFYAWQEAIHNAVKHGACSEVNFRAKFDGQMMQVSITDNGKGFDQAKPGSGGNGLLNMRKRAEELGGSFQIQSQAGKGTRVEFRIPLGG